jgi:ankyrin repeat protein
VPTKPLPPRPHLDHFRREARARQRAAAPGDPAARLSGAQFLVAREYGFASWPRLRRYLKTVTEYGWDDAAAGVPAPHPADEFCRLACLTYTPEDGPARWAAAERLRAEHPELTRNHLWAAAAAASAPDVERLLAADATRASARGGPFNWRPLSYLAYSRVNVDDAVPIADRLLAAGADPNEGHLFGGLPYVFTAVTGVLGHGELGPERQPRHPQWRPLLTRLLAAGADPNDGQALYNTMFRPENEHLEVLFAYGLGRPHPGPWRARVGEVVPGPAELLRILLRWAVEHDQRDRVRLLAEHGVDIVTPFRGDGPPWAAGDGRTAVELARRSGHVEIADYLIARGAPEPAPDPVSDLIAAAFRGDRSTVDEVCDRHPGVVARARAERPGLVVWAAAQAPGAVDVLVELGFDVNAMGRADAPVEQPWQTALHHSAGEGDVALTRRLLALGADPHVHDARFDATPLGWARYLGQAATAALLEPLTRPE